MNTINAYSSQTSIQQSASVLQVPSESENQGSAVNLASSAGSSSTIVSISEEARAKLAEDQAALGKSITEQMHANDTEEVEETSTSDTEKLDEIIEDIQDQIKEVQKEIKALKTDDAELAEAQRKMLDSQLASLNATLMGLMGKKLDATE